MVAGQETDVQVVHGLTRPEFSRPCDPATARAALGLPADRQGRARLGRRLGRRRSRERDRHRARARRSRDRRVPVRPQRRSARRGSPRATAAKPRVRARRVHRADERVACRGRRARALDRRPHRARGVRPRLPDDLLRLGPRPHPRRTTRRSAATGSPRSSRRQRELGRGAARRRSTSRPAPGLALGALPSAASLVLALVA